MLARAALVATGAGVAAAPAACGQASSESQNVPVVSCPTAEIASYYRWQGEREPLMAAQVDDFQKLQPKVRVNNRLMFPYDYEKLTSMIVAGTPPDVIMIDGPVTADWASRGTLVVVDDLLKRDRLVPKELFYAASVPLTQHAGKHVAMPHTVVGADHVLWVNLDLWTAAGLDTTKLPKTWDDLLSAGVRLTRRSGEGFDQIAGVYPGSFKMWATANGMEWISPDRKKVLFSTPEAIATLEYMLDATNRLYGSPAAMDAWLKTLAGPTGTGLGYPGFVTNKVAMQTEGAWQPYRFGIDAPQLKYAAAVLPFNGKNAKAKSTNLADSGWNYAIVTGSKSVDAAWEWTKYITAGEGNRRFFWAQGRPAVTRKFNESPEQKKLPYWDVVLKTMEQATPLPMTPAWTKVTAHLTKMTSDVLTGKLAPRAAVEEYARLAQTDLDQVARSGEQSHPDALGQPHGDHRGGAVGPRPLRSGGAARERCGSEYGRAVYRVGALGHGPPGVVSLPATRLRRGSGPLLRSPQPGRLAEPRAA